MSGRKEHEEELDALISGWTRGFEPVPLMEFLQGVGVPAGAVNSCEDLFSDKQLAHRGHYVYMDHTEMGRYPFDGTEFTALGDSSALQNAFTAVGRAQ